MKLPDDKNERNKILGLIAVGVIAACYVGYNFGIKTLLQKQHDTLEKISDFEEKIRLANIDIKQIPIYIKKNHEIIDKIVDISENKLYILHPNLGNFLLVAEDIIESHANRLNLTIKNVKRKGGLPSRFTNNDDSKKDSKAPRFAPYTVNVEIECGFADFIKLIQAIEEQNPYLCITRIGIIGQPNNVTQHVISFDIQWPIWLDAKIPMKLVAEQMLSKSQQ